MPATLPPPLPEEDQMSAFIKELPPPTDFMDVDALPSPPRVYHPVTGAPLHSCSLVMHLPSPEASPSVSKPMEASASADGVEVPLKEKKTKNKGKGKVAVPNPVTNHTPSPPTVIATSSAREEPPPQKRKVLKRKCAPKAVVPSEPGSFKLTCSSVAASKAAAIPSTARGSGIAGPSVKSLAFLPRRFLKRLSARLQRLLPPMLFKAPTGCFLVIPSNSSWLPSLLKLKTLTTRVSLLTGITAVPSSRTTASRI